MLPKLLETILNLLFPRVCVGCGVEGSWACPACVAAVPVKAEHFELPGGLVVTSFLPFESPLIRELLHTLKYNSITEIAVLLTEMVAKSTLLSELALEGCLVSVPTSQRRLRERGYNQAELVARSFGNWLGLPVRTDLLVRRAGRSQVGQGALGRQENLVGVFEWTGITCDGPIILVDDLCTTGSTLAACAKALVTMPVQALAVVRTH
jgi:competence protein ComFC